MFMNIPTTRLFWAGFFIYRTQRREDAEILVPQVNNCLEDSTISNPVHTSETRMCGGFSSYSFYCLEGSTSTKGHV